jgi:hypothetical protein
LRRSSHIGSSIRSWCGRDVLVLTTLGAWINKVGGGRGTSGLSSRSIMSILRVGSTGKYSDGWALAFGKRPSRQAVTSDRPAKENRAAEKAGKADKAKTARKKPSKKKAAKRRPPQKSRG